MHSKYLFMSLVLVVVAALIMSCAPNKSYSVQKTKGSNIVQANSEATDQLLSMCNLFLDDQEPIIVTSLVNIDDMGRSSTLGRMSSEIIANRLSQHGFKVREVKMGQDIFVDQNKGEFILSRELQQIGAKHEVQGFIVGTYAVSDKRERYFEPQVVISLRFVDTENNLGCSHNYVINNTDLKMWE